MGRVRETISMCPLGLTRSGNFKRQVLVESYSLLVYVWGKAVFRITLPFLDIPSSLQTQHSVVSHGVVWSLIGYLADAESKYKKACC